MSWGRHDDGLSVNVWITEICLLRPTDRLRVSVWIRDVVVCLWSYFFSVSLYAMK